MGFAPVAKTMAGVGRLKRICRDVFCVAGAIQEADMFRGQGADFVRIPEEGCILEHEIMRFPKVTFGDRCTTSYDLASLFRGRHHTLDRQTDR